MLAAFGYTSQLAHDGFGRDAYRHCTSPARRKRYARRVVNVARFNA